MSLDDAQQQATRDELAANRALAGLSTAQLAHALDWDSPRADAALAVDGADPRDVWLVRDYLAAVIRASGREPLPYTSLTDASRAKADGWFGLYEVPAAR